MLCPWCRPPSFPAPSPAQPEGDWAQGPQDGHALLPDVSLCLQGSCPATRQPLRSPTRPMEMLGMGTQPLCSRQTAALVRERETLDEPWVYGSAGTRERHCAGACQEHIKPFRGIPGAELPVGDLSTERGKDQPLLASSRLWAASPCPFLHGAVGPALWGLAAALPLPSACTAKRLLTTTGHAAGGQGQAGPLQCPRFASQQAPTPSVCQGKQTAAVRSVLRRPGALASTEVTLRDGYKTYLQR